MARRYTDHAAKAEQLVNEAANEGPGTLRDSLLDRAEIHAQLAVHQGLVGLAVNIRRLHDATNNKGENDNG